MLKNLAIVVFGLSILLGTGILLAANQIQFGGSFQPLVATVLILAGFLVPFAVPRQ